MHTNCGVVIIETRTIVIPNKHIAFAFKITLATHEYFVFCNFETVLIIQIYN